MATATTATRTPATRASTTTRTTTTRARATGGGTASKTRGARPAASTAATRTREAAERTLPRLVVDGAYATLGLGDVAVEVVRTLPERVQSLREVAEDAPTQLLATPQRLAAAYQAALDATGSALADAASRGRRVLEVLERQPATKRAIAQTRVARSQVKGATTSVRRAIEQGAEALEAGASRLGART